MFGGLQSPSPYGGNRWYEDDTSLMQAVRKVEGRMLIWLRDQCRRFSGGCVSSRYDFEDLYSEALLLLTDAVQCWDIRPEGEEADEFEALLRQVIHHRLVDRFRTETRKHNSAKQSVSMSEGRVTPADRSSDPVENAIEQEMWTSIRKRLDTDERRLLDEILRPSRLFFDVIDKRTAAGEQRWLKRPSREVYSKVLKWRPGKTKRVWGSLIGKLSQFLPSTEDGEAA